VHEIDEIGSKNGHRDYPSTHKEIIGKTLWECSFLHSSVLFRSVPEARYREDVRQADDWELFHRLQRSYRGANLSDRLVYCRLHPSNLTDTRKQEQRQEAIKVVREFE
jgi:hypothetical protein